MNELCRKISTCIERGKVNKIAPFPKDMLDQDGADELTKLALEEGVTANEILLSCNDGMQRVGDKFSRNEVFVPELLMAAKAMNAVMAHLKPFFQSGNIKTKGKFVIGTVAGDLHDIGKNLVSMVVEGNGWEVVDLGIDVKCERFLHTIQDHPNCIVGLSALLTTTMVNMITTVKSIKEKYPNTKVIVGGAPLSEKAAAEMGADAYAADPQEAVEVLKSLSA